MSIRQRILAIDDDPLFRNLLVTMLRKDFIVSVASEGSEGYYKAIEHPPDVAFVDIQMPGWDGLKTLKSFRSHPALAEVKVVMLTGDTSKETVLAAIHGGASNYLIKTHLTRESLQLCLEKVLPNFRPQPREAAPPPAIAPHAPMQNGMVGASAPSSPRVAVATTADARAVQEIMDSWE